MYQESYQFLRGQIWYWEDPVYGEKNAPYKKIYPVRSDECVRYSRYVLILQTLDSMEGTSILAAPCSSGNVSMHDIHIKLPQHKDPTYIRIHRIFPANVKCLKRYICTLSNDAMNIVEEKVASLLFDSYQITSAIDNPGDEIHKTIEEEILEKEIILDESEKEDILLRPISSFKFMQLLPIAIHTEFDIHKINTLRDLISISDKCFHDIYQLGPIRRKIIIDDLDELNVKHHFTV